MDKVEADALAVGDPPAGPPAVTTLDSSPRVTSI